jgi:uncharacterized protein (TIGR01732 family)
VHGQKKAKRSRDIWKLKHQPIHSCDFLHASKKSIGRFLSRLIFFLNTYLHRPLNFISTLCCAPIDDCLSILFSFAYFVSDVGKEDFGMADGVGFGGGFALIVVLFILLIIVGASFVGGWW